jgi:hypothetical protein
MSSTRSPTIVSTRRQEVCPCNDVLLPPPSDAVEVGLSNMCSECAESCATAARYSPPGDHRTMITARVSVRDEISATMFVRVPTTFQTCTIAAPVGASAGASCPVAT